MPRKYNRTAPLAPKVELICQHCGKTYYKFPSQNPDGRSKFCSRSCLSSNRTGEKHGRWKGGRNLTAQGYVRLSVPKYPGKNTPEHRWVMEQHLGRPLEKNEHIHHLNGDKMDNRIENLEIVDRSTHNRLHFQDRLPGVLASHQAKKRFSWSQEYEHCIECGSTDRKHCGHGLCSRCYLRAYKQGKRERRSIG